MSTIFVGNQREFTTTGLSPCVNGTNANGNQREFEASGPCPNDNVQIPLTINGNFSSISWAISATNPIIQCTEDFSLGSPGARLRAWMI